MTEENPTSPASDTAPAAPASQPPAATPPVTPPAAKEFAIPEAYKDKPWAGKIKSEEDLYKQIDNLQGVVGKKTAAPDFTTATDEEKSEYFNRTRPADKTAYKFNEGTPEHYADAFFDAGISEYQASKLIKFVQEKEAIEIGALKDPVKFDEELKKEFGGTDDWQTKADAAFKFADEMDVFSNEDKIGFDEGTNAEQMRLYRLAKGAMEKIAAIEKDYKPNEGGHQSEGNSAPPPPVDLAVQADDLLNQIHALDAKQPPDFKKIEELNTQLKAINARRVAKNESI